MILSLSLYLPSLSLSPLQEYPESCRHFYFSAAFILQPRHQLDKPQLSILSFQEARLTLSPKPELGKSCASPPHLNLRQSVNLGPQPEPDLYNPYPKGPKDPIMRYSGLG